MNDKLRMKLTEFLKDTIFLNSLKGVYSLIHNSSFIIHNYLNFFSLNAFKSTDTELKLMAAAAIIGFNNGPPKI